MTQPSPTLTPVVGAPSTITRRAQLTGIITYDGPYQGGSVGAGLGSVPIAWDATLGGGAGGWKNTNTNAALTLPLARADVTGASAPTGQLVIDLTWVDESGVRQSDQLRLKPIAGADGVLDLTRDQTPTAVVATPDLVNAVQQAAQIPARLAEVDAAVEAVNAEWADTKSDIAQAQADNDARQAANDTGVSTALSRLAPLSGASYPNGVTVGGREVSWGFRDDTGRFWMQFDPTGKLFVWGGIDLSNVTNLNAATVTSTIQPLYIGEYEGVPLVQDPNGRVGQALLTDGRMLFPNGIVAPGLSISGVTTDPDGGVRVNGRRAVSSRDQYRVGDSLSDLNNSTVLTTGTGRQLSKNAVGGQTSTEIAARIGAWPVYAKPTGNSVPASGAVGVTIVAAPTAPHVGAIDLLRHTGDRSMPGWLGGVYGTLSRTGGVPNNAVDLTRYTFTRQSAGAAVATDAALGVQFVPDLGDMLNRTVILWAGNNNYFEPEIIKRDVRACVATFQALRTRFVLLTLMNGDFQGRRKNDVPNTDYQRIIDYNTWLMNEFPRYALDIRTLMPRTADTDVVDPAYRVDGIHLTNPGYDLVDTHTLRFELERGW